MLNPYESLGPRAFWRTAVAEAEAVPSSDWCRPKWRISGDDRIATIGSCFAQHLGRRLRKEDYQVLDYEPAPAFLPQGLHPNFGYGLYSARYGNVYTSRQMLQLVQEAFGLRPMNTEAWCREGRYYDALRPTIEADGHASIEAVHRHRSQHIQRVADVLRAADVLVFTLGLTECWENAATGIVYPVCPGVGGLGSFDSELHKFRNLTFSEILRDITSALGIINEAREGTPIRVLLTVSPVPLTATASPDHVLVATSHSKSTLRAVAGELVSTNDNIDYFPSYEIVTNPWNRSPRFSANMRSVTDAAVDTVMTTFLAVHRTDVVLPPQPSVKPGKETVRDLPDDDDTVVVCDEALLEAFNS